MVEFSLFILVIVHSNPTKKEVILVESIGDAMALYEQGIKNVLVMFGLSVNSHIINIPAGVEKVKIMTYWHDKEASTSASVSLVNDINTK